MTWFIFTVLAVFSRAVYSLATRILSSHLRVSSFTQGVLLTSFASVLTIVTSPLTGGINLGGLGNVWLVALVMIFSQALGNIIFFKGQEKLDAGNTQIAFSSILVWGVLLSMVFLNSRFSATQALGIILLLAAIIISQYRKGVKRPSVYAIYIIGSAALFAVFQVTSAQLAKFMTAGTYLLLAYLGSTLIISLMFPKKIIADLEILKQDLPSVGKVSLFASGTSVLYFLFSYFAYRLAPDRGVVVVLLTTQVVLSVILGIIFLKEHERIKNKLAGGFLALIASLLIKI